MECELDKKGWDIYYQKDLTMIKTLTPPRILTTYVNDIMTLTKENLLT